MMRKLLVPGALAALLGLAGPAGADPLTVGPYAFHRRPLENGLRAVAVRDTGSTVSVFMIVAAGKRQESPETNGIAHLTEHAMYAGTVSTPAGEHDARIKAMGGESNAYTRDDYTLYYDHLVPVDRLDEVLAMEADRLRGLAFPEAAVLHERDRLVKEEQKTWQPSDALRELVESVAYRVHPYRAGVLDAAGNTIAPTLGVDAIRAFYDRWYHPRNAAVVVVGPVDEAAALDAVGRAFGALPGGPEIMGPEPEPYPVAPRAESLEYHLSRDRVEHIWVVPGAGDPDRVPLDVLARLLKREAAPDGSPVDAQLGSRADRELFRVAATGDSAGAALDVLLDRARREPPADAALAEVKGLLRDDFTALPLRARPYFSLAGMVGVYDALGLAETLAGYEAAIDRVDGPAVLDVARRRLSPETRITVTVTGTAKTIAPLPDDRKALADAAQEAEAAGDLERAAAAYTKLLDGETSRMYQVIYLASRGQIKMAGRDYDGAIADFEAALVIVDYPAVRDLLEEAKTLKQGAALRRDEP